jgi:hypothetical protein
MNAKVHDTIGVSPPAELLFGQAINFYSGLLSAIPLESLTKGLDDAAGSLLSNQVATNYKIRIPSSRALESYVRFSPIFGGCGDTPWFLESLVSRNPTYPVALALPDPDRTRQRGL